MPTKLNAAEIEKTLEKKLTNKLQANIKQIIELSMKNLWKDQFHSECKSFIDSEVNSA